MELKRCEKGHFYDGSKFTSCPHCNSGVGGSDSVMNVTVPYEEKMDGSDDKTTTIPMNPQPAISTPPPISRPQPSDDGKTIGYFGSESSPNDKFVDPVVGWLVCTVGTHKGEDFRLKSGRNFIGRNQMMDVALTGEKTVSREIHAIVAFEPKQSIFLAQPGSGAELFYVNDNVVLSTIQLHRNDRLQIGEVELMLIPCCDENFHWQKDSRVTD